MWSKTDELMMDDFSPDVTEIMDSAIETAIRMKSRAVSYPELLISILSADMESKRYEILEEEHRRRVIDLKNIISAIHSGIRRNLLETLRISLQIAQPRRITTAKNMAPSLTCLNIGKVAMGKWLLPSSLSKKSEGFSFRTSSSCCFAYDPAGGRTPIYADISIFRVSQAAVQYLLLGFHA